MQGNERGSTRSHSMKNSLWNILLTRSMTGYDLGMMMMMMWGWR